MIHGGVHPEPPALEVADVFRRFAADFLKRGTCQGDQYKVLCQLQRCRTEALGGHRLQCPHCHYEENRFHSCRNRHCPKCQYRARQAWLEKRLEDLLPVSYYHFVATLPHQLNPWVNANRRALLGLLFRTVSQVLQAFAHDPQWRLEGELGVLSVLHTWNQKLRPHYHLHNLIPAGVLQEDGTWKPGRKTFIFRKSSLAKAIRSTYLKGLLRLYRKGALKEPSILLGSQRDLPNLVARLRQRRWIVYLKQPFAGPEKVLKYLGRYTHRIAISNHRIQAVTEEAVHFSYLDRTRKGQRPVRRIQIEKGADFVALFLSHVLPSGFMKIRYYGFLGSRFKKEKLARIRQQCQSPEGQEAGKGEPLIENAVRDPADHVLCPQCEKGSLIIMDAFPVEVREKALWAKPPPKPSQQVRCNIA